MEKPQIRADIDGLRAVAVVIVLLFHAGISEFRGGFVGVDVFFVISGFLIAPQIVSQIREGRFSFRGFMERRIRRLAPALVPVLLYAFFAALLLLGSGALREFLDSLVGAALFVSNYVFLSQSGYFARSSDTILLLHTWSLGVEFQFYLIAPLLLALAGRWRGAAFLLFALASFGLSLWAVGDVRSWAFYGVLPRFWELAVGGLIGLYAHRLPTIGRASVAMRAIGLALIAFAALTYDHRMAFPGAAALLPVAGAALLVAAPATGDVIERFLSCRPLQWIGLRSYSLYLWHWPLIVTVALIAPKQNDVSNLIAVAISVPLAALSYRFVETPVRKRAFWRQTPRVVGLIAVPAIAMAALWSVERWNAGLTTARDNLPLANQRLVNNLSDKARDAYLEQITRVGTDGRGGVCSLDQHRPVADLADCVVKAAPRGAILVLGDSHAPGIMHAVQAASPSTPVAALFESACGPADYVRPNGERCFNGLPEELPGIVSAVEPRLVILVSRWRPTAVAPIRSTIEDLQALGTEVVIIGPGPVYRTPSPGLLRTGAYTGDLTAGEARLPHRFRFDVAAVNSELAALASEFGAGFIDRFGHICDDKSCAAFVPGDASALMIWDNNHLSLPAIDWFGEILTTDPVLSPYFK